MIFIFTALYCEARMIIEAFQLEKNVQNTRFQEFYREDAKIRLTITGVGEIAAAAAVAGCCAQYPGSPEAAPEEDFLLNLGICGGNDGMEGVFLCNCLTEQATGKSFYPDMLYRHAFPEAQIVTGMTPWKGRPEYAAGLRSGEGCAGTAVREDSGGSCGAGKGGTESEGSLYDMEAAAVYQAGRFFFGPHRMMFLKVVSDHGADGTVTAVNDDPEYGHNVWVDHGNGYTTIYRNQGEVKVKQGETVTQGTTLFLITDNSSKLGYQMMKDGAYVNPMDMLEISG